MKKFYILLVMLFIINMAGGQRSIPAFSINASSQSKYPTLDLQHRTAGQRSLIQVYDSIYTWVWDTIGIGWKIDSKITDIIYNANNNMISIRV